MSATFLNKICGKMLPEHKLLVREEIGDLWWK